MLTLNFQLKQDDFKKRHQRAQFIRRNNKPILEIFEIWNYKNNQDDSIRCLRPFRVKHRYWIYLPKWWTRQHQENLHSLQISFQPELITYGWLEKSKGYNLDTFYFVLASAHITYESTKEYSERSKREWEESLKEINEKRELEYKKLSSKVKSALVRSASKSKEQVMVKRNLTKDLYPNLTYGGVYVIMLPETKEVYIGSTGNFGWRFHQHAARYGEGNKEIFLRLQKGELCHMYTIKVYDRVEAYALEQEFLDEFITHPMVLNKNSNAVGDYIHCPQKDYSYLNAK